ncbi:MAG: molybdopterin cofactor-binding domain-containing protein, partial [Pseudomonadota bacterium]
MGIEGIGARALRKEDKRFITGKGRYTDDHKVAGMMHAAFVRSPHAHAKINGIDKSAAEAMEGVIAVFDGKQLTGDGIGNIICGWMVHSKDGSPMNMGAWSALATEYVRYVGDGVCVVIAETLEQAKAAGEAVEVDYEVLDAVVTAEEALAEGAPQLHPEAANNTIFDWEIGEAEATQAAIDGAAHVVELDIRNNRLVPNPMEPRSALAQYDSAEEHFTLHTTSQNPHVARLVLSAFYQVAPENKLRVIAPDVGGGFGAKIYIYPEEIVCLWACRKAGVDAVKWTCDRSEAFLTDAHGLGDVVAAMG